MILLVQARELPSRQAARFEVQELGEVRLVLEVAAHAFLQEQAELAEPRLVRLGLLSRVMRVGISIRCHKQGEK